MDIFPLIGLWETVRLGFQLQSQYQMSKSLVNNSPIYYPPLKEVVRGSWGQKGPFLSWIEEEKPFLPVSN